MAKLTLTDPTGGYSSNTLVAANNALIEAAIENTLSRDGTSPNTMGAALDMNSNKITNLTDGTALTDAVTVGQLTGTVEATLSYTASNLDAEASTANQVLLSDGAAGAAWGDVVVLAGDVNAESSTDGWVLTSDGAGNAAWEANAGGNPTAGDINAEASADGYVLTSDGAGNAAWEATVASEANDLSAAVTWANVPDANITEGSVTQHTTAVVTTAAVTAAGALMDSEVDADIKTLALPASTTISAYGATLVDDADAATAIATLGLDADLATLAVPASTTVSAFGATLVDDADAAAARTTLAIDAITPGHGEMGIAANSTATTVSVADTYYQVTAGWAEGSMEDMTFATNELVVTTTGTYLIIVTISFTGAAGDTWTFGIAENDSVVPNTTVQHKTVGTDVVTIPVTGVIDATAAATLQLYGKNNADTNNFTVKECNYSAVRIA